MPKQSSLKRLIIYSSIHHGNTQKIAEAMAEILGAELYKTNELKDISFERYDLIGFGSGIFHGKHHAKLYSIIENANIMGKDVFVFSTSGTGNEKNNRPLIELLKSCGAFIKGSFSCKGYDTYGIFKLIGGIAKGHPNNKDLERARNFVNGLC